MDAWGPNALLQGPGMTWTQARVLQGAEMRGEAA